MAKDVLFTPELREQLAELSRPHPSFLVSLLIREEAAIVSFRNQIEAWWSRLERGAKPHYGERLCSLDNDVFFQAFAELAIHEIFRYHDIQVLTHADEPGDTMHARSVSDSRTDFGLGVLAYLPEVQIRGSMSVYRHLVRELNEIHHHYNFSVYLKKWLPYDFDPRPIKRALEVWLDSLDDGSWHGKYAEYRDDNIHLEFSILDKLNEDRRRLVRFRISPLRAPDVTARMRGQLDKLVDGAQRSNRKLPLVATLFSNEEWGLPAGFFQDFLYGKADYSFHWTTHGGRTERLKTFSRRSAKYGLFVEDRYDDVAAVVLCDKEWERDKVVFTLQVHHNPWAKNPIDADAFGDFAQYRPIDREGNEVHLAWSNLDRTRFRLP